tara:strand:- start:1378 stop:1569 length:192 start_codon:yes stop_codon:yes gene_type:complete
MSRLKIVKKQVDESTFQDWREEDYMNKMNFNPLVMFVVIPTVVQAACLLFMGGAMLLNTFIFA